MIRELRIQNFRAFRELTLAGLGRVNLLVGSNNCGKTSVLEAAAFLASGGDPSLLYRSLSGREERATGEHAAGATNDDTVDVRHLFHGRRAADDASLTISAVLAGGKTTEMRVSTPQVADALLPRWRDFMIDLLKFKKLPGEPRSLDAAWLDQTPRSLVIERGAGPPSFLPLLPEGALSETVISLNAFNRTRPVSFLSTTRLDSSDLADLYEQILLTPEEAVVIEALREIEPGIVRLATRQLRRSKRGFVVGMEGAAEPVPLGSLGDGVHRLLAIVLSLVNARGGYLLVDEIDTGLHHTVMEKMWRLVFETAKRLDVTVFATTHSFDCVRALAAIASPDIREGGEVSLVRIERDPPRGVHFTEAEISHLAEWQIEAR